MLKIRLSPHVDNKLPDNTNSALTNYFDSRTLNWFKEQEDALVKDNLADLPVPVVGLMIRSINHVFIHC
jgi:hypothetical protein